MVFETYMNLLTESRTWECVIMAKGYTSRMDFTRDKDPVAVDLCKIMRKGDVSFPILVEPFLSNFMFDPKELGLREGKNQKHAKKNTRHL
jgi:hypothetical protein